MATKGYQETFIDNNSVRNLVTDNDKEKKSYANPNYVADGTKVVQRTQPPQNADQRDYEHWYEMKKCGRKWLLLFFVAAVVIIIGMFVATVIMATATVNDEDGKDQQINTLQEHLENNLTSMIDNVDGKGQQIKTLRENFEKNLTSIIGDVNAKDQQTKKTLENLQRNLTSLTNEVDLLLLLNMSKVISKTIDGWYLASDGLHYKFFFEWVNYATAKSRCEDVGGMLLTKGLRNASVFRAIEDNLLPTISMQTRTWIGFHELEEGDWHWLDGGATNTEVVVWHEGEPNNYGGKNEACANIIRIQESKAEIIDDTCTFSLPFVCEH